VHVAVAARALPELFLENHELSPAASMLPRYVTAEGPEG